MVLKQNVNWNSIVKAIRIYTKESKMLKVDGSDIKWKNADLFRNCQYLDVTKYFDLRNNTPLQIFVETYRIHREIYIYIQPKNIATFRLLKTARLGYSGNIIGTQSALIPRRVSMILKIFQTLNTEKDGKCKEYPFNGFKNFGHCDYNFLQNVSKEKYNVTPFWGVETFANVSKPAIYPDQDWFGFADLFDGTKETSCFLPCLSTKVKFIETLNKMLILIVRSMDCSCQM